MSTGARIADVAYTRYDGERSGRPAAIWSLARWSALRALGARRGWKAKLIPILLTMIALTPALVVLGLRALFSGASFTNNLDIAYARYSTITAIVILVFSVVITPELVCPDRRDRTLSLYFSTSISRLDYVLAKILGALLPLLLVTLVPVLVLYVGNVLFAVHPLGYFQAHDGDLLRIIGGGLVIGCFYGVLGLAVASLTGRRAFAVGGYLAVLVIPTIVGGTLGDALNERYLRLMAVAVVPIRASRDLYPGFTDPFNLGAGLWNLDAVGLIAAGLALLALRYRRDEG
jgi:ABC-2 type transport system permease protein